MKKMMIAVYLLIICLVSSNGLAADNKDEKKVTDLTPWKGYAVSIVNLYKGEDGEKFFDAVLKHAPKGYNKEMVKAFYTNMFSLKFNSIEFIDENTLTIDGKMTGDYAHVGTLKTKFKQYDVTWDIFKTDSKDLIAAGFKYFLLIPFHQHGEDGLRHSHFRYGNENFDFLATDPSVQTWWPTIYQPDKTNVKKVMASMTKGAKLQATMLPKLK